VLRTPEGKLRERVSKDEDRRIASWFETRGFATLLTKRIKYRHPL
jgi:hypothetical protein